MVIAQSKRRQNIEERYLEAKAHTIHTLPEAFADTPNGDREVDTK